MSACCFGGRWYNIKTLIKQGADIYQIDNNGWTALHYAARYAKSEIIDYLLSLGMKVNMVENSGKTPLMCACCNSDRLDNIKTLIKQGADIHQINNNGWTALHYAARFAKSEIIEYLLSLGMKVNMVENSGKTPLMCTCCDGYRLDNIKTLIKQGADIHQIDSDGWTALHYAARFAKSEIIEYLLSLGMKVNMVSNSGQTPLMSACCDSDRLDNIKTLIKQGADIHQINNNGWTALHYAARYAKSEIIEHLLSLGMKVNMVENSGKTPLMCTCCDGYRLDNIKTLIKQGADIHQIDSDGRTALHYAARFAKSEIIEYLFSLGMKVNMVSNSGQTPLMCACCDSDRLDNIKTLIKQGADIHQINNNGWTALHYAARFAKSEIIEYLLSLGMKVNMVENSGKTPLMCTCCDGYRLDNIKTLIKQGADIHQIDSDGCTALHYAARFAKSEIIEYLLSLGMKVNMVSNSGQTLLMSACCDSDRLDNIKTLIKQGADIHQINNNGWTALHYAARFAKSEIIEHLLSLGMKVNMVENSGKTPLLCACCDGYRLDNIKTLIKQGADIHQIDSDGCTALHYAARFAKSEIIEYLLSLGMKVNVVENSGQTPLMCACYDGGCLDNIKTLIKQGADIHQINNNGWTALHYAARYAKSEIIEHLLSLGMKVNMVENSGQTPLMCACCDSDRLDNIKTLIKQGADIHQINNDDCTALHCAARFAKSEIIEHLLSLGMKVNMVSKNGQTPLMCACYDGGCLDNIKTLIKQGADIHQIDNDDCTALHFAAKFAKSEIIEYLLSLGMKVNMVSNSGQTPLMCACYNGGCLDNIKTLIKQGADIYQIDSNGWTALHFAANYANSEIIEYLLSLGMKVNMVSNSGQTPLLCACCDSDRLDNIKTLIKQGADIHQIDSHGCTALHFAARFAKSEIIEYLLSLGMKVNVVENSGQTPLMCACYDGGCLDNIKTLIKQGADIHQIDSDGCTALHYAARFAKSEIIEYLLSMGIQVQMTAYDEHQISLITAGSHNNHNTFPVLCRHKDNLQRNLFHAGAMNSQSAALLFKLNCFTFTEGTSFTEPNNNNDKNSCRDSSSKNYCSYSIPFSQVETFACNNMLKTVVYSEKFDIPGLNSLGEFDMSPLMIACERNNFENAELLIRYGAKVNLKSSNGFTAFHFAAKYGSVQLLQYLLINGGNLHAVDTFNGNLVSWACEGNKLEVVKFLDSKGVSLHIISTQGWNLLHIAVVCANIEMIEYLLENNVSPQHLDNNGMNPLSLACETNREDAINFFLRNENYLIPHNIGLIGSVLNNTASVGKNENRWLYSAKIHSKVCDENRRNIGSMLNHDR